MACCKRSDIENLIPTQELAELATESGSTPEADVITEAITRVDTEIDAYLGMIYPVPLSTTPDCVRALPEDIALYCLYLRRSAVPEARQKASDDAIALLQLMAAGKAVLSSTTGSAGRGVQFSSAASIFDQDNMTSWQ